MLGLDRKAIPKNLEVSYGRNQAHYRDLRGRPLRSKPLFHRDPTVEALPSRFPASIGDPIVTDTGTGRLELVLDAAATMPLAVVDGEAVAVGEGTIHVVLPVGPHVVEVQGGDTCSPVVVDIADQAKTRLIWLEEADRQTRSFGRDVEEMRIPVSKVFLYEWLTIVFLLCGLPAAVVNSFLLDRTDSRVVLGIVAVIGVFLAVFYPWKRRERARVNAQLNEHRSIGRSQPRHYPWDGPAAADRPALLGEDPEYLPEFKTGYGALLLRIKAHRHLWKHGDGVCVRDAERAGLRVDPPKVCIDGFELPATWGNWWYPLPPGKHVVEVECNAALSGSPQRIGERIEIEVQTGEAAAVHADAHVFADRGDGEDGPVQIREGSLYIESEEFHVQWMDDPAKRLEFWNARS